ncbi:MAG: hypothetical protein EOR22_24940 [Mesorhizobium sp.]|nr:MAG: hypothetical protein EOR22_24940 [Mesorhizobium sp.]
MLFVIDVGASGDHDGRDTKYLIAGVRRVRGLSCDQLGNRPSHISSDNPSQRQSDWLPAQAQDSLKSPIGSAYPVELSNRLRLGESAVTNHA